MVDGLKIADANSAITASQGYGSWICNGVTSFAGRYIQYVRNPSEISRQSKIADLFAFSTVNLFVFGKISGYLTKFVVEKVDDKINRDNSWKATIKNITDAAMFGGSVFALNQIYFRTLGSLDPYSRNVHSAGIAVLSYTVRYLWNNNSFAPITKWLSEDPKANKSKPIRGSVKPDQPNGSGQPTGSGKPVVAEADQPNASDKFPATTPKQGEPAATPKGGSAPTNDSDDDDTKRNSSQPQT